MSIICLCGLCSAWMGCCLWLFFGKTAHLSHPHVFLRVGPHSHLQIKTIQIKVVGWITWCGEQITCIQNKGNIVCKEKPKMHIKENIHLLAFSDNPLAHVKKKKKNSTLKEKEKANRIIQGNKISKWTDQRKQVWNVHSHLPSKISVSGRGGRGFLCIEVSLIYSSD